MKDPSQSSLYLSASEVESLLLEMQNKIRGIAWFYCDTYQLPTHHVDDMTQEVLLNIYRYLPKIQVLHPRARPVYCLRLASNTIKNYHRSLRTPADSLEARIEVDQETKFHPLATTTKTRPAERRRALACLRLATARQRLSLMSYYRVPAQDGKAPGKESLYQLGMNDIAIKACRAKGLRRIRKSMVK